MSRTVLYVASRYPKVTETFVVNEWLALRPRFDMRLAALIRTRERVVQRDARAVLPEVVFVRGASLQTLAAHVRWFVRDRRRYTATVANVLRGSGPERASERVKAIVVGYKAVRIAEVVRAEGVAHVHAHFANHPATVAWVVHRLTGVPFSFTAHANDLFRRSFLLERKLDDAAFIVAVSEYNADLIRRMNPTARVQVVHCGVDVDRFRPETRAQRGCRLLCVASFEPKKGHRYLLEAVSRLRIRFPELRLVLIGDGADRAEAQRLAGTLGIADQVDFRGACTSEDVRAELCRADLFVLPSVVDPSGRMEGIPVALMEAMASAVPVVATRLSGIPELVSDGAGILVEPNDSVALADAIARVLGDEVLWRTLAERGRARVVEAFDLFNEAKQLGDRFEHSIAGRGADG